MLGHYFLNLYHLLEGYQNSPKVLRHYVWTLSDFFFLKCLIQSSPTGGRMQVLQTVCRSWKCGIQKQMQGKKHTKKCKHIWAPALLVWKYWVNRVLCFYGNIYFTNFSLFWLQSLFWTKTTKSKHNKGFVLSPVIYFTRGRIEGSSCRCSWAIFVLSSTGSTPITKAPSLARG